MNTDDLSVWQTIWQWLVGLPLRILITLIVALFLNWLVHRAIRVFTSKIASEKAPQLPGFSSKRRVQRARTLNAVLSSTVSAAIWVTTLLIILDQLSIPIGPLLASAGIVGVAIGFGAQSLVKDVITGIFMLVEDQYGVGDVIDAGPAVGTVESVGLRVTKLRADDGTLWFIPNGTMTRVGNQTQGWSRAKVRLALPYDTDITKVLEVLGEVAAEVSTANPTKVLARKPAINAYEDLSASAIAVTVSLRTEAGSQWEITRELRRAIREALRKNEIALSE